MLRGFWTVTVALALLLLGSTDARAESPSTGLELHVLECGAMIGMETESFLQSLFIDLPDSGPKAPALVR